MATFGSRHATASPRLTSTVRDIQPPPQSSNERIANRKEVAITRFDLPSAPGAAPGGTLKSLCRFQPDCGRSRPVSPPLSSTKNGPETDLRLAFYTTCGCAYWFEVPAPTATASGMTSRLLWRHPPREERVYVVALAVLGQRWRASRTRSWVSGSNKSSAKRRERARIAADMHDDLGAPAQIAILGELTGTITGSSDSPRFPDRIAQSARCHLASAPGSGQQSASRLRDSLAAHLREQAAQG
jgi:hypothetical protein